LVITTISESVVKSIGQVIYKANSPFATNGKEDNIVQVHNSEIVPADALSQVVFLPDDKRIDQDIIRVILTVHLSKQYGAFTAVDDLNLHVQPGEIYGFLGPNGAGKTTSLMMILGLVKPTAGHVEIMGQRLAADPFGLKRRIGVVAENVQQYDEMTAQEYLTFFARLYRVSNAEQRIQSLMERVHLWDRRRVLVGGYSRGMRQKLSLCRALLHDPDVLLLDEPVSGLDPRGIRQVRELLLDENQQGKTIVISSHILSEIERTAHRIGIIAKGRLLVEDSMDNLRLRVEDHQRIELELHGPPPDAGELLQSLDFVEKVTPGDSGKLILHTNNQIDRRPDVARVLAAQGLLVTGMRLLETSLEDAFVTITDESVESWLG
jgi:ABC-2 type transport system ATP-binding protein